MKNLNKSKKAAKDPNLVETYKYQQNLRTIVDKAA
jgi:hypothetical protein